jgi:nitroreductase
MRFPNIIKNMLRPLRDILYAFFGYLYDFFRYFKYAGWRLKSRESVRDYNAVKIYHRLEKNLSFRWRDTESGWGAAADLVDHLKKVERENNIFTYHETVGLKVLGDFITVAPIEKANQHKAIVNFWQQHKIFSSDVGGTIEKSLMLLQEGKLDHPEKFFLSRFSVRDFDCIKVLNKDIVKAIELALNTPSVCNRQASFVYCLYTREEIDRALSLQNGNRGFGHEIPCLLILCANLSAFDTAGERYQQWIDGGMFSMSLVWALHSLGLATCCLNWSKGPVDDMRLRSLVPINDEHTVLMMLAVGFPREYLKVCYSARKPVDAFYKNLD